MTMMREVFTILTLLLLDHTDLLCNAEEITRITGIHGGSVHLSPMVPAGFKPREVFWRHLSPTDHLVASFSRGSLDTTYQSCFHGRVQIFQNFTLAISEIKLKDIGMFACQMVDTQGHMKLHQFNLTVYEVVSKPTVQVFVSKQGEDCAMFLSCNVTTGNNLTYNWIVDTGQEELPNETYRLYDDKRLLKTTLSSTQKEVSFTCVVSNPVSQEHTSVIPWTSCVAEPRQNSSMKGNIVIFVAAFLIILFTTAMTCVYLFTRSAGKTTVTRIHRANEQTEETILQLQEENEVFQNEQNVPQHHEEATDLQNGERTFRHDTEREIYRNEDRRVQFSHQTLASLKVETIV